MDLKDIMLARKLGGGGGSKTVTITWDGNTEGLTSVNGLYYKVRDYSAVTKGNLIGCTVSLENDPAHSEPYIVDESEINDTLIPNALLISDWVIIVSEPTSVASFNFEEAGFYFSKSGEIYVSSFTYTKSGSSESGGGAEITDGIVVKARGASGYATEADVYFGPNGFANCGCGTSYNICTPFYKLEIANIIGQPIFLPERAFQNCQALTTVNGDFSEVTDLRGSVFYGCKLLSTPLSFPKFTGVSDNDIRFQNCISLPSVQLGSIGYGIKSFRGSFFSNCSQTGFSVTAYTQGVLVDDILSKIRNGCANATITIKACEDTTYNGVAYTAGEVMITSTP